jgi:protein-disulfide isomerase
MDISRRELFVGGSVAITSASVGFASGMAFQNLHGPERQRPNNKSSDSTQDSDSGPETVADTLGEEMVLENRAKLGHNDADIQLIYWNDYQCPFCTRFDRETLPEIQSNFIESGDVQLILKPIALFGKGSQNTSLSTHCILNNISDSAIFWDWHKLLYAKFENQSERNNGWSSPANLAEYATEYSQIDSDSLQECVSSEQYRQVIQSDTGEANKLGLEGTPFFVIRNTADGTYTTITGAQPYQKFQEVITDIA